MCKSKKGEILEYLAEYIIFTLNELKHSAPLSDFGEGSVLAFIECLEILSLWKGFKKYGISDIEKHFDIK